MKKKDILFQKKKDPVGAFEFNEDVASVFDDMLTRSVPLYKEGIRRQALLALEFYQPGTWMLDFGCSNGNLGMMIGKLAGSLPFSMKAVDSSGPMLDRYRRRLAGKPFRDRITLVCDRIENVTVENASVVIINLTLQFLDPSVRESLIKRVYQGLAPGGILLLTEKTVHANPKTAELYQRFYCQFKRDNGYSDLEISQKREALENVLIPETLEEHVGRLERAGFSDIDVWMKWFNFASILAIRKGSGQ